MRFSIINWKAKGLWFPVLLLVVLTSRSAWAQVDLVGEWTSENFNYALDIGDYTGIPFNEAGRLRAETWAPDQSDLPENVCRPHPFDMGFRVGPSDLDISKQVDPATLQIVAYHFHTAWSDLRIWMDGRPGPSDYANYKWSGFSTGKWDGNTLIVRTDHLKEGYFTRTGAIRSAKATVTMAINRYGKYMTAMIIIYDPAYLTEPYIQEASWVYQPYHIGVLPTTCEPPDEGAIIPAGSVPNYLPGENKVLSDFAAEYGLPPEAALGGAETEYPEYIQKMKTMKRLPRTANVHFKRTG
jgi:hypothetical protein